MKRNKYTFFSFLGILFLLISLISGDMIVRAEDKLSYSSTISLYIPARYSIHIQCGDYGSMYVDDEYYGGNLQLVLSKSEDFTITAVPDEGYELKDVVVSSAEGVSLDGNKLSVVGLSQDLTIKISFVKQHIHSIAVDAEQAPTCTETGLSEGQHCSTCGEILVPREVIPATGHLHTELRNQKDPEIGVEGYTGDIYCTDCGKLLLKGETTDKLEQIVLVNNNNVLEARIAAEIESMQRGIVCGTEQEVTLETPGRMGIAFSATDSNNGFSLNLGAMQLDGFFFRAYVVYKNEKGEVIIAYS